MLKICLHLRNALIKFLIIEPIVVLKMETKKLIKNGLGKNLTKSYLLIGKIRETIKIRKHCIGRYLVLKYIETFFPTVYCIFSYIFWSVYCMS